jgi:non-heme Fe2+,alpha-ketoglutarate-dependent halogenase
MIERHEVARRGRSNPRPGRRGMREEKMNAVVAAAEPSTGDRLSPAQVARYREAGYHFPLRVMSAEEAAYYMRKLTEHEAAHGALAGPMRHKAHLYLTWLDELVRLPAILDVVGDILGPDLLVYSSSFFIKEAHDPSYVSWHQDAHYWGLDSADIVTAWVALVDSITENGAMRVVPGTHLIDLPHIDTFAANNLLSRGQEVAVDLGDREWIEMPLKAGEISLHHVGIVHGSEPNRSDGRRVGFAIRYMAPHVKQTISVTDGATLVRGVDRFGHFEHEPAPKADMDPEALAFHRFAMDRLSQTLMTGTDKTMAERR